MRPGGPSKTGKLSQNKKIRGNISVSEGPLGHICYAINVKFSQIVDHYVSYKL